jgi:HK97 family phage major capsid protein
MARTNVDVWIPEEQGSNVLKTISTTSAVDALATKEPMASDTKAVPVLNGVSVSVVAKGSAYPEDVTADAELILKTRKLGTVVRLADEDLKDAPANLIANKQAEWAKSYAVMLDNACLAVTAAENGTTVPFTSVYNKLSTADAGSGYTANANIIKTVTGTPVSYDNISALIAKLEQGNYFGDVVLIAHPAVKQALRGIKDSSGAPIFIDSNTGNGSLFGYDLVFSKGARTSAVATSAPTGNALLIAVAKEYLLLGTRSGPESALATADSGASFLTDEALLKMRARRAFQLGNPGAAAILEIVP